MKEVLTEPEKGKRNWWKIGFFVLLFVFEVTREWAVIAQAEKAEPNVSGFVSRTGPFVTAEGTWKRLDSGSPMQRGITKITCLEDQAQCTENSVAIHDQYVFAPDTDHFDATFSPDAVTYENDDPECAKYSVRIDLALKKVFAVRERKDHPTNTVCNNLEPRIEMQLVASNDVLPNPLEGHFVPVFWTLRAILG